MTKAELTKREYARPRLPSHVSQLAAWKEGREFFPIRVNLSPAGACNHHCRFCYVEYLGHPYIAIARHQLEVICTEAAQCGVYQILFEGIGEPLLNPGTIPAIIEAKKAGLPSYYLVTNGVLLTPDKQAALFAATDEHDSIRVSSPEATPELYALTHGCAEKDWHKLMANLDAMQGIRNGRGTLILTVYPTPDMVGNLCDTVRMCVAHGADIVQVTPPILKAANAKTQNYRQDLREAFQTELILAEQLGTDDCAVLVNRYWFDVCADDRKPVCCEGIDFYACVGPDAMMYPCFRYWLNKDFAYGNLDEQSFRGIWVSERRKEIRARVLAAGPDDGTYCRNCAHSRMNEYLDGIRNPSRYCGAI